MKYIILFIFLVSGYYTFAQTAATGATSFAIIIDQATYDNTKPAVDDYKKMLEQKERLSTHLLVKNWKSPEEVKAAIRSVASQKPALEGAVFIGHIPVAMVRNAQHMTTAFKMDEMKFPIEQSSIASDRFYDDFDLKFRFLKKDDTRPDWFYYELDETSPQRIDSDIYTARIMSHGTGRSQYDEIRSFLQKAVAARNKPEILDHLLAFTGHGYNSESLTAWTDEQVALRELFPRPFQSPYGARVLNYRMENEMKFSLFTELQRPETDLALLSEHGDISVQYINGAPAGSDFNFSYNQIRASLRTAMRRAAKRGQDTNLVKKNYTEKYNIPADWFAGTFNNDSLRVADSLADANGNIISKDLQNFTPNARVVLFNACYNGSFHHPDNISQAYIFNKGKTLVAQGNTVNALQDKWALNLAGLLNRGVRVGLWHSRINSLETHLTGDPTWHFTTDAENLNTRIVLDKKNISLWKTYLLKNDPLLQSLALYQLAQANAPGISELLLSNFRKSEAYNIRMQCLVLLSRIGDNNYKAVLSLALNDPYELIRRKAAEWIAKSGDDTFIPGLVKLSLERPNDERVVYNSRKSLSLMNIRMVKEEIQKQINKSDYIYNKDALLRDWLEDTERNEEYAMNTLATVLDKNQSTAERIQAVRMFRNNTHHGFVPQLLTLAEDKTQPAELRTNIIETLGWFSTSYQKASIVSACRRIMKTSGTPDEVNKEAAQTVLRMEKWSLQ